VELFFRWIKMHLRIKAFYGTSENAVKTQIWIALSIYGSAQKQVVQTFLVSRCDLRGEMGDRQVDQPVISYGVHE